VGNDDVYEILAKLVDLETGLRRKEKYYGAPEVCDCCSKSFEGQQYMIDGGLKGSIAWANMCAECFSRVGTDIGWGKGQLYLKHEGSWLMVAGFPTEG
jgi:hypothetical protein